MQMDGSLIVDDSKTVKKTNKTVFYTIPVNESMSSEVKQ